MSAALKLVLGLSVFDALSQSLPVTDAIERRCEPTFFAEGRSYFEKQDKNQCGGYSSAYVLRCLGEDVAGEENYQSLGHKFDNGYVLPQALTDVFARYGYAATLYRGDLESLKTRLALGGPVVVLIGRSYHWQHYITVVGYDEENIYAYDSNRDTDSQQGYNRVLSNSEFINLWENGIPLFERAYFVIDSRVE